MSLTSSTAVAIPSISIINIIEIGEIHRVFLKVVTSFLGLPLEVIWCNAFSLPIEWQLESGVQEVAHHKGQSGCPSKIATLLPKD